MGHAASISPTAPESTRGAPTIALIGDGTHARELAGAAPRLVVLEVPFDPPCEPEALARHSAVFLDACSDVPLAVAECARLRAGGLSLPITLLTREPRWLRAAADRVGATRVFRVPLAGDEVREFVRRCRSGEDIELGREVGHEEREQRLDVGPDVVLDRAARRLSVRGAEQPISVQKFELLCYLADRPGRAVDPRELVRAGVIRPTQVQRMRALMAELRDRLGPAGALIRTVPGFGYRLDLPR